MLTLKLNRDLLNEIGFKYDGVLEEDSDEEDSPFGEGASSADKEVGATVVEVEREESEPSMDEANNNDMEFENEEVPSPIESLDISKDKDESFDIDDALYSDNSD